jgi:hypothetical protein
MSGFSDLATYRLTNTIYGEVSVDAIDAAIKSGVSFSDSVTGNNISIRFLNASNSTNFIVNSASVISANISPASTPVANTYYKMAGGAQLDNYDVAWAGVAGTHDSAGAMPINPIRCYFGVAFGNNTPLNGKIKRAMILPRKMTLAELQTKTT